jgi:hypothetical protein
VEGLQFGFAQPHRPSPNGDGSEGKVKMRAELLNVEEFDATAEKNYGSRLPRRNIEKQKFDLLTPPLFLTFASLKIMVHPPTA